MLNYGEPQIFQLFKNMFSSHLYWVLFPIENLRQIVETVKMKLTMENLDRQLAGESIGAPQFLTLKEEN